MDNKFKNLFDKEGRITRWPKKKEQKLFILKYLQDKFEKNRTYTEKEINETLNKWHLFHDHAILRREMYDNYLMGRKKDGREYWVEENDKSIK